MWGGRFATGPGALMEEINASIDFDKKLWRQDIRGSLAHAAMLAETGILTKEDVATITAGLNRHLCSTQPARHHPSNIGNALAGDSDPAVMPTAAMADRCCQTYADQKHAQILSVSPAR